MVPVSIELTISTHPLSILAIVREAKDSRQVVVGCGADGLTFGGEPCQCRGGWTAAPRFKEEGAMIKNGWTEKIESLETENAAMKVVIKKLLAHGEKILVPFRSAKILSDLARLALFVEGKPK